jgi:translation initiation factor 3 subunit G
MAGRGIAWGDEDDDDYLPPRQESTVDAKGIKTVVEWSLDDKGQKIKTTTKVRVFTQQQRTSKSCFERQQWALFGEAAASADNSTATIRSKEDIFMETPAEAKEADENSNKMGGDLQAAMETMRKRNALRRAGVLESSGEVGPQDDDGPNGGFSGLRAGGEGKYVPPSLRRAGGGPAGDGPVAPPMPLEDRTKIRVTNISEDTTEGDLRELFGAFGRIYRVYLAKDPETMQSRGFAFVSYTNERDAQNAMDALQGYGYDYLILKVRLLPFVGNKLSVAKSLSCPLSARVGQTKSERYERGSAWRRPLKYASVRLWSGAGPRHQGAGLVCI